MEDIRFIISCLGIFFWNILFMFRWNCLVGMLKYLCLIFWKGIKWVVFVEFCYDWVIFLGLFWDNSSGEWCCWFEFYILFCFLMILNKMYLFSYNLIVICILLIRKWFCWYMFMYMGFFKLINMLFFDILVFWNNLKLLLDRVKIIYEIWGVWIKELRL